MGYREERAMGKGSFKDLRVWQRSKKLAVAIYKATEEGPLARDFGLRDQMRRAGVSVCSNVAEGDERNTDKDAVRFFYMAKGSLAELITQIEIAGEVGYLDSDTMIHFEEDCGEIGKMLGALIKAREKKIRQ